MPKRDPAAVPPLTAKHTKLVKQKKVTNVGKTVKPKVFMVSCGTPNQMGEPEGFASEAAARSAAIDFFDSYRAWCERFNKAGIDIIVEAIDEVGAQASFLMNDKRRVVHTIDDYSGMTLCVEMWQIEDPALAKKAKQ